MSESRPSVLVVDDEPGIVEIYEAWLEDDYRVLTASNGTEALSLLDDGIDVVLLDRRMERVTGDEVLNEIRRLDLDCRVAMITAVEPDIDIIELGFDEYLTKPVSREEVLRTVDRLLDLQECDELVQEFFALTTKKTALEACVAANELESTDEYRHLLVRLQKVKTATHNRLTDLQDQQGSEWMFKRLI